MADITPTANDLQPYKASPEQQTYFNSHPGIDPLTNLNNYFQENGGIRNNPNAMLLDASSGATPAQATNANNGVYKDANNNVFRNDGSPIDQATFQSMGLNIDHINTGSSHQNLLSQGAVTTGTLPDEQAAKLKAIEDRLTKSDSLISSINSVALPTDTENNLQKQVNDLTSSMEAGKVQEGGRDAPMGLVTGRQALLEQQGNQKIAALQRELTRLSGNRTAQYTALNNAYTLEHNSIEQLMNFYDKTSPQNIHVDEKTGTVFMRNPLTGEVTYTKMPGFIPPEPTPTSDITNYKFATSQGYKGTFQQYLNEDANRKNTAGGGSSNPIGANGMVTGATGSSNVDTSAAGYSTQPVAGGLTQAAIDQAATQYAITGVMPSMGLGSTGAAGARRVAIQNRAAELANGTTISSNKAKLTSLTKSLTEQTDYVNTTERSLNSAETNMNQVINSFKGSKLNPSDSTLANRSLSWIRKNITGGDQFSFDAGIQEVKNDYAIVFSRGGSVTDQARKAADQAINDNISFGDLQRVATQLATLGQQVVDSGQKQIDRINTQMGEILNGGGSGSNQESSIKNDIKQAIKDTVHFPNREALINAIAQHYGIPAGDASKKPGTAAYYVYNNWPDNTTR